MYDFHTEPDPRDPKPAEWQRAPRMAFRVLLVLGITAFAMFVALIVMAAEAGAHDALPTASKPLGWKYPFSCCSDYDCRAIGDGQSGAKVRVFETAEGYRFSTSTTELVPYGDPRVKESPDGQFHWCTVAGADDGRTICLFVPPRSY